MDAQTWDERYRSADLVWGAEPNRFVREQCEGMTPGDALDVACGEGRNSIWLAGLGWRVTGLDFSSVAIERARSQSARLPDDVQSRLTWGVADVTQGTVDAASVDLVVLAYLHLAADQVSRVLVNVAQALRTGGTALVVGHDRRNLTEGVSGPQDLALLYDAGSVRRELAELGLRVERAETVERRTEAGVALDTLVRAVRP